MAPPLSMPPSAVDTTTATSANSKDASCGSLLATKAKLVPAFPTLSALGEERLSAMVARDVELQELLLEHGGPRDANDQYKTLLDVRADLERDISVFAGAVQLLAEQHDAAETGASCTVCFRDFSCAADSVHCLRELDLKIRATELARDESEVLQRYQLCKAALSAAASGESSLPASPSPASPAPPFAAALSLLVDAMEVDENSAGSVNENDLDPGLDPACQRVKCSLRTGSLTELRNQKAESLQDQRCFACLRCFTGSDLANYLRTVDRRAYVMFERLHHT